MGFRTTYGNIMKIYSCGYNFILGRFYGIINLSITVSTLLTVKGMEVGFSDTIILLGVALTGIMIFGLFFVKAGLMKAEAQANFIENPQQMEILSRIRRIEDKLDKLGCDK